MKKKNKTFLSGLIFLAVFSFNSGNDFLWAENVGVIPLAAPYYTPDTSWALGAFVILYWTPVFETSEKYQNELGVFATYTLKNQSIFAISPEIYINEGKQKLSASLSGKNFPSSLWGIGPDTKSSYEENYISKEIKAEASLLLRIKSTLYAGPLFVVRNSTVSGTEGSGILADRQIAGSEGNTDVGTGFIIQYDTRDSYNYPTEGMLVNYEMTAVRKEFGSDYNYLLTKIDARFFYGIYMKHVIAAQVVLGLSSGTVPFQSMNNIGGDDLMRGYNSGRFIDNNSLAAQLEYRFPIAGRFAGVLFASAGEVQPEISDLVKLGDLHYAAGFGLRFILDKKQHVALRGDIGFDEKGNANIYFLVKEAF